MTEDTAALTVKMEKIAENRKVLGVGRTVRVAKAAKRVQLCRAVIPFETLLWSPNFPGDPVGGCDR